MSKGVQMILGATALAGLLTWYAMSNLDGVASFRYYETLVEFQTAGMPGDRARVHGYVADGTIERDLDARQVRFAIQSDPPHGGGPRGEMLAVEFRSLEIPDLFKDGAEVVVEGQLERRGVEAVFLADSVLAKCPSKFQAEPGVEARSPGSPPGLPTEPPTPRAASL